ncbi:hypothetical protein OOU_Y34scaffold00552g116 [Pyricularia oryzae Y34]|uniref:Solute carrier family 40 protein n=2 Tax=Pyricularia oryzae TaxID=318829 RepID=A0AA97PKK9_PYRO3|nr:hypothetical protein OOU_Y34scaffold00552g116 [Pyricularia oryzae Y34]
MPSLRGPIAIVAPALLVETVHAVPTTHFDQFFPFWNEPEGATLSSLISPVISCIFETLPEHRKAELGASAVILGLLPTILQSLGSTPPETALLSVRRPLLATLLALGSPSVTAMKTSNLMDSFKDLVEKGDTRPTTISAFRWNYVTKRWRVALSAAEYVAAIVSAANVVYLAYQLGSHAIVIFAPETIFMLPLWTFICIIIHFGGVLILHLKLHVDHKESRNSIRQLIHSEQHDSHRYPLLQNEEPKSGVLCRISTTFRDDVIPAAFQRRKRLRWRKETILVNFLIWVLSMGTLANLVFGSVIFSSLLFFSVRDVLLIVGRYFISALFCRGIVRLELAGFKECTFFEQDERSEDQQTHVDSTEPIPLKDVYQHPQREARL